jgi:hypothetical protein
MVKKIKITASILFIVFILGVYLLTRSIESFIWTTLLSVLCIWLALISFLFLNILVKKTNWYNNQFIDTDKFVTNTGYRDDIQRNYEVVNLGSNPAKFAFFYQDIIGFSWSTGSQSLDSDFKILKNYYSYLKDGGTVLIPFVVFSSCFEDNLITTSSHYAKLYNVLDPELIDNYSYRFKLRYITYPILSNPLKALIAIVHDIPMDNRLELNAQLMDKRELERDAQKWIESWKDEFKIQDISAPISEENLVRQESNIQLVKDMIDFCIERNLKPILIIPPVTKALSSRFSETFRENYIYSFIRNANTSQVTFLNYFDDDRLSDPELYFNSYFLNLRGRKLFTQQVLTDLKLTKV